MTNAEKVVVGVSMNPNHLNLLHGIDKYEIIENAREVTMLHVFNEKMHNFIPKELKFPEDMEKIKAYCIEQMEDLVHLSESLGPEGPSIKIECLFGPDTYLSILNYLSEEQTDLFIAAAPGEYGVEGLFKKPLPTLLIEDGTCDVYVLKGSKKEELFAS